MIDINNPYTYVICPVCNQKYGNLYQHTKKHGYPDAAAFKEAYQLDSLCSQAMKDASAIYMAANNPSFGGRSEEEKAKMSKNRKGKGIGVAGKYIRTPEIRKKIAIGVAAAHMAGAFRTSTSKGHKGYIYSFKMNKDCYYASTWEKRLIQCFDKWKRIVSFTYEQIEIPYDFLGDHLYIPDFIVEYDDGIKSIWEVKRQDMIDFDYKTDAKIMALDQYCFENNLNRFLITLKSIENLEKYLETCPKEELNEYNR